MQPLHATQDASAGVTGGAAVGGDLVFRGGEGQGEFTDLAADGVAVLQQHVESFGPPIDVIWRRWGPSRPLQRRTMAEHTVIDAARRLRPGKRSQR